MEWRAIPGGLQWIGHDGDGFRLRQRRPAPPRLSRGRPARLAAGDERRILAFIEDGGYARPELWLSDGWNVVNTQQWEAPLYWEQIDGEWWTDDPGRVPPSERAEPVCHVSFYEADAFARWAGAACRPKPSGRSRRAAREPAGNFLESGAFPSQRRRAMARNLLSASATSGSGPRARTPLIRDRGRPPGRLANTTRSSCATSSCSAAARARRPRRTSGPPTAISSRPRRAGNSPESGWRKTMTATTATSLPPRQRSSWRRSVPATMWSTVWRDLTRTSHASISMMKSARLSSTRSASSMSTT